MKTNEYVLLTALVQTNLPDVEGTESCFLPLNPRVHLSPTQLAWVGIYVYPLITLLSASNSLFSCRSILLMVPTLLPDFAPLPDLVTQVSGRV